MTLKVEDPYWKTDGLTTEELLENFNSSDGSIDDNCADEGVNTGFLGGDSLYQLWFKVSVI